MPNRGDYLVDDRPGHNGADRSEGELIRFGKTGTHKTWPDVVAYLRERGGDTDQASPSS